MSALGGYTPMTSHPDGPSALQELIFKMQLQRLPHQVQVELHRRFTERKHKEQEELKRYEEEKRKRTLNRAKEDDADMQWSDIAGRRPYKIPCKTRKFETVAAIPPRHTGTPVVPQPGTSAPQATAPTPLEPPQGPSNPAEQQPGPSGLQAEEPSNPGYFTSPEETLKALGSVKITSPPRRPSMEGWPSLQARPQRRSQ